MMQKIFLAVAALVMFMFPQHLKAAVSGHVHWHSHGSQPFSLLTKQAPDFNPEAFRRGGFRSPRMGYTGGNRARNPAVNSPAPRTPAAPATTPRTGGFFGGLFGGFLAGSLISSLLNPFGIGTGAGVSLLGILFWGVILYFIIRFIRRRSAKER